MNRILRSLLFIVSVLALCAAVSAQRGAVTMQRTLPELIAPAGVIVRGHVITAVVEPHPQYKHLMTVVVTMSAESTLKGKTGATYTFRQFIWDQHDVMDAAGFRKGQEWLLVLNPVNGNGLTSPVGLEQGRFRIVRNEKGVMASNGRQNLGLFTGASAAAQRSKGVFSTRAAQMMRTVTSGPVPLQDLEDAIRGFVGADQ